MLFCTHVMTAQNFHSAYWNLIVGCIGILSVCLIPFFLGCVDANYPISANKFQSIEFQNVGMLVLFSTFPVLIDVALDILTETHSEVITHEWIGRTFCTTVACILGIHLSLQSNNFQIYESYDTGVWVALW